jgi:hypothetical protein
MAVARDLAGTKENVIAFAGDAAFTNGISFEALNNIAQQTKRLIVVLNDNEWSIDRNVGAIANYLHKIVTNERYTNLHDSAARLLEKLGGKTARQMVRKAEEAAKGMLWPSMLFEEFGLTYYGPLDGHNIGLLIETFQFLKTQERPVLLHAITQKGRGFQPALDKQKKFHGLGPYDPDTGETTPRVNAPIPKSLPTPWSSWPTRTQSGGHHRGHAQRNGARSLPSPSPAPVFRCGHRRGARRHLRRRPGHDGLPSVLRHLLHFPAACLRSHRARRLPAEPAGRLLHGSRWAFRR